MLTLKMSGQVVADPTLPSSPEAFSPAISLDFSSTYQGVFGGSQPVAGTDLSPFVPQLGAITKVRAFALRAVDGQSLVVKLSSAAGTDQAVPVSDFLIVRAQNDGDELTAIKVVGTGRIEYLIGGDTA